MNPGPTLGPNLLSMRRATSFSRIAPLLLGLLPPVTAEDETELEMFTHSAAAKQAVAHRNKVLSLTRGAA